MAGVDGSSSPGTANPSPKTRSVGDALMSGLSVVRIANMTIGSLQNHSSDLFESQGDERFLQLPVEAFR